MKKLLIAGALAIVALLVLIWYQLHTPVEIAAAAPAPAAPAAAPAALAPAPSGLQKAVAKVAAAETKSDKMETDSDEFFFTFQDVVTQVITRNAVSKCYEGGIHSVDRHAKVKFTFRETIKDGKMAVADVKMVESTINDAPMIACFQREIEKSVMENARWPDYDQPDMVLIRPGSNAHKFSKEAMSYEGSGPDFTKDHPVKSAP